MQQSIGHVQRWPDTKPTGEAEKRKPQLTRLHLEARFSPALILHVDFLGRFLFDQLPHSRLEVLWKSQKKLETLEGPSTRLLGREKEPTQENHTLAVEDHHQAVLELGGQVEGEAGPRQTGQRRRDLLQDVAQDVVAARASAALGQETGSISTQTASGRSSPGVFDVHFEEIPPRDSDGLCGNQPATATATGYMTLNEENIRQKTRDFSSQVKSSGQN